MSGQTQERVGFEAWLGIKPCGAAHDLAYEAFKTGAAWQRAQGAVPEGYALVPVEPGVELLTAMSVALGMEPLSDGSDGSYPITGRQSTVRQCYVAMLAAPAHPAERQEQEEVQRLREAQWTTQKPTEPGAYWIRGFRLFEPESAPALVEVADDGGELVCNLHESNSQDSLRVWSPVADFNEEFEWLGPLQALAASTGQERGEVQRLREALERATKLLSAAAGYATKMEPMPAKLLNAIDAELDASTGQEVEK